MTRQNDSDENKTGPATGPALAFDPARYADAVASFDLTEVQKQELLSALWSIMRSFVELGFTVDVCAALLDDPVSVHDDDEVR